MIVKLDKKDIVNMIVGIHVEPTIFSTPSIRSKGQWLDTGQWVWYKRELNELSKKKLFKIYHILKRKEL